MTFAVKNTRGWKMSIEDILNIVTVALNIIMFVFMEYERRVGIPNYPRLRKGKGTHHQDKMENE